MPSINTPNGQIIDPGTITVIVGRNGSGKSRFLREITSHFRQNAEYHVMYVAPERGGIFEAEASIEQAMIQQSDWVFGSRNRNQGDAFKKTSAAYLKQLEILWGRRLDKDLELRSNSSKTFQTEYIDKINYLLLNIRIVQDPNNHGFVFQDLTGEQVKAENISSGESEAVSLATELLYFLSKIDVNKTSIFLLDEPDVHLHPDLQVRLARFIIKELDQLSPEDRSNVFIIVATHSTSLACALSSSPYTKVGTKHFGNNVIAPRLSSDHFQQTAKFFAHPLSHIIAEEPLLIVEGDDDTRVLQQAARSSEGRIKIFPCTADTVDEMTALENFCNEVLQSLYDNPVAYSLRDGDGVRDALDPVGCVQRYRLQCYAIENLLLTDEFLNKMNSSWQDFQARVTTWCETRNVNDPQAILLQQIAASADRFRDQKIKNVRTIICAILGSNKPWEFLLGQTIAELPHTLPNAGEENSIISYIGIPVLVAIGFASMPQVE